MSAIHTALKEEMAYAQASYAKFTDQHRTASLVYRVGDRVWLNAKNIRIERPSKKLDAKNLGPFEVSEVVSPRSYRLKLPASMKIHNVFYTSLLHLDANDPLLG